MPEIRTNNEVESLAAAVTKMSEAMQGYVKNIVYTESELARMAVLANKDALTGVRNKNAYDAYAIELQAKMRKRDIRFAVGMIDINDLKGINDTYGHEKGDIYIMECCKIICETFEHSPVFRVGGDEFVVVILGEDYDNRAALVEKASREYEKKSGDKSLEPWERASAAIGVSEYNRNTDTAVDEIFDRADKEMYAAKAKIKQGE
ncbi:MAG: GGDEF domain-containing protein [Oscillospiraceae bacterium]|nr:GGDEF domain-containing protein [Oscillospiraceae bacterium]